MVAARSGWDDRDVPRAYDAHGRTLAGWHQIRCNDTLGFVRYEDGLPVELRTRCRNRHCRPEDDLQAMTHRWDLVGLKALEQRDDPVPRIDPRRVADQED